MVLSNITKLLLEATKDKAPIHNQYKEEPEFQLHGEN
jgi:hypothetical protein